MHFDSEMATGLYLELLLSCKHIEREVAGILGDFCYYYHYFSRAVTANSAAAVSNISTPMQNKSDLRHCVE